jgi:cytochrome c oxidase subunit 1
VTDLPRDSGRRMTLPLLWLAATIVLFFANDLRPSAPTDTGELAQTYYVVAHRHYAITLVAALAAFGAIYFLLEMLGRVRYRRGLGFAHFGLMCLGIALIISPSVGLNLTAAPQRYTDPMAALTFWSTIASVGYAMTLAGLVVFVLLLGDAVRLTVLNPTRR